MSAIDRPIVEPLGRHHDRAAFSCGVEALDRYLRTQAGQDDRRNLARVFVAVGNGPNVIAGYYTLSSLGIDVGELPVDVSRRLPRYRYVPAALIGRLAASVDYQGRGLGGFLLIDALRRIVDAGGSVASFAVLVDAKDESAVRFYEKYGFLRFRRYPDRLFLPIETAKRLFDD